MFFLRKSAVAACSKRQVMVGPPKGLPTVSSVPHFGKHLASGSREARKTFETDVNAELRAEETCKNSYGFLRKPLFLKSWVEFEKELQRIELQWSLAPGSGGVITLKLFDHWEPEDGLLCELKGSGSKCTPIPDFFECCGSLLTGLSDSCTVLFAHDTSEFTLLVTSEKILQPPDATQLEDLGKKDLIHTIGLGTMVNLLVIDKKTNIQSLLFHKISLLALNYAFLSSIPIFLKRNDIGVRNFDFVSKDQMRHFRFAWCFIRSRSSMTPVDMTEIDRLLPA